MKNIIILTLAFFLSFPLWWGMNFFQDNLEAFFYAQISQPLQAASIVKIPEKPQKPELNLESESAISLKINKSGRQRVVFSKESQKILPIASLTKLMTALVAWEENDNLWEAVTVSQKAANQEDIPIYGNLKEGEVFTVEKLIELTLIYSSNDAAFALSQSTGSYEEFLEKMNQKAKILGAYNTRFINPTGLDPENPDTLPNHSTAKELALLAQYIIKLYPEIFEISLKEGPYPTKNGVSDLYLPGSQEFIGAKTGYTEKAGGCMLVVFKDQKDNTFFNVILGTASSESRIQEMQKLINWVLL